MKRITVVLFVSAFLWLTGFLSTWALAQGNQNLPLVNIQIDADDLTVFKGTVRIGDIATVECENAFLANRIRSLDLEVLSRQSPTIEIQSEQIEYRLVLAGVKREQIAISGATKVLVELQDSLEILNLVTMTIRQQISKAYGCPEDFCQLALRPEASAMIERSAINWRDVSLEASLPAELKAGEQTLPVDFFSGSFVFTLQLPVVIRLDDDRRPGSPITNPNQRFSRAAQGSIETQTKFDFRSTPEEMLNDPQVTPASFEIIEHNGTKVLRTAKSGQKPGKREIVVSRNSVVQLTQRVGSMVFELKSARAAEDGAIGDVIELIAPYKSPNGGEIRLLGTVVGPSQLELVR